MKCTYVKQDYEVPKKFGTTLITRGAITRDKIEFTTSFVQIRLCDKWVELFPYFSSIPGDENIL